MLVLICAKCMHQFFSVFINTVTIQKTISIMKIMNVCYNRCNMDLTLILSRNYCFVGLFFVCLLVSSIWAEELNK